MCVGVGRTFLLLLFLPFQLRGVFMVYGFKFAIQVEKNRTLTSDVAAVPYGETMCPPWPWLTLTFWQLELNLSEWTPTTTDPFWWHAPPHTPLALAKLPNPTVSWPLGPSEMFLSKWAFSSGRAFQGFCVDLFQVYDLVCGCLGCSQGLPSCYNFALEPTGYSAKSRISV